MYNFVFYFIYRSQVNQKNGGPFVASIIGSMFVFVTIFIHLIFILGIYRFALFNLYGEEIFFSNQKTYAQKMFVFIPFFVLASILVFRFYNEKRRIKIIQYYNNKGPFYTLTNIILFVIIFFLPIVLGAVLLNHSSH